MPLARSPKARHDLLAEEAQRVQHAIVRDQTAAIQLGEDAVEADLVAQLAQPLADAVGGADDDVAAQRIGVGQGTQAFGPVDERLAGRSAAPTRRSARIAAGRNG